jgi:tRNA A-37 threonylcarbamoyl transferase component Bud32
LSQQIVDINIFAKLFFFVSAFPIKMTEIFNLSRPEVIALILLALIAAFTIIIVSVIVSNNNVIVSSNNVIVSSNNVIVSSNNNNKEIEISKINADVRIAEIQNNNSVSPYSTSTNVTNYAEEARKLFGNNIPYFASPSKSQADDIEVPDEEFSNEYEFNKHMHAVLIKLISGKDMVLLNTEHYKYLKTGGKPVEYFKPDFCITAKFNCDIKAAPKEHDVVGCLYGAPLCVQLVDTIFEAKMGAGALTDSAIGKMYQYLHYMKEHNGHTHPRGFLYNQVEFIFFVFGGKEGCSTANRCRWDTEGSKELFLQCLKTPNSCCSFILALKEQHNADIKYLGNGATGTAIKFTAKGRGRETFVMKFCAGNLTEQYNIICAAHSKVSQHVIEIDEDKGVVDSSFYEGSAYCTSYYMTQCGSTLTNTKKNVKAILLALYKLHANDVIHGDCRLANVLKCGSEVVFIDFYEYPESSFGRDVTMFIKSVIGRNRKLLVKVENAIGAYAKERTEPNILKVHKELYIEKESENI